MGILKTILMIIFYIVTISLIILSLIQVKEERGVDALSGKARDSFYEKNKGKTKEGKMELATKILFVVFIILIIAFYFI